MQQKNTETVAVVKLMNASGWSDPLRRQDGRPSTYTTCVGDEEVHERGSTFALQRLTSPGHQMCRWTCHRKSAAGHLHSRTTHPHPFAAPMPQGNAECHPPHFSPYCNGQTAKVCQPIPQAHSPCAPPFRPFAQPAPPWAPHLLKRRPWVLDGKRPPAREEGLPRQAHRPGGAGGAVAAAAAAAAARHQHLVPQLDLLRRREGGGEQPRVSHNCFLEKTRPAAW